MQQAEATVYLNGQYASKHAACWSVEDRGTLFADGVYEVVRYYAGRPFEIERHINRLQRSLAGIRLAEPGDVEHLKQISDAVVERNGLADAKVYWQITRGAAPREHAFPTEPIPGVLVMAYPAAPLEQASPPATCKAALHPDRRWADCWIKSLMLLPNVLAKQAAHDAGADEAILHHGQTITEGSATSVMAVCGGTLYTHPLDGRILGSITRQVLLEAAAELAIPVRERAPTVAQLRAADEVIICGTTTHVAAVTHLDDQPIADGAVGPVTQRLHAALLERMEAQCLR
jgi:D-alanine transaminase